MNMQKYHVFFLVAVDVQAESPDAADEQAEFELRDLMNKRRANISAPVMQRHAELTQIQP
jgi:hypothetical protein